MSLRIKNNIFWELSSRRLLLINVFILIFRCFIERKILENNFSISFLAIYLLLNVAHISIILCSVRGEPCIVRNFHKMMSLGVLFLYFFFMISLLFIIDFKSLSFTHSFFKGVYFNKFCLLFYYFLYLIIVGVCFIVDRYKYSSIIIILLYLVEMMVFFVRYQLRLYDLNLLTFLTAVVVSNLFSWCCILFLHLYMGRHFINE